MSEELQPVTVLLPAAIATKARVVAAEDGWRGRSTMLRHVIETYLETRQPAGSDAPVRIEALYPTAVPVGEDR